MTEHRNLTPEDAADHFLHEYYEQGDMLHHIKVTLYIGLMAIGLCVAIVAALVIAFLNGGCQ